MRAYIMSVCLTQPSLGWPRVERVNEDGETKRLWKRFQMVTALPEKEQRAVIRLINSYRHRRYA
jgi:hypothetical protein